MNAEDRVALILGRTIIRAEALQAENEQLRARLTEFENGVESEKSEGSPNRTEGARHGSAST